MKRLKLIQLIALMMVAIMAISFTGCGDKDETTGGDATGGQTVQTGDNGTADDEQQADDKEDADKDKDKEDTDKQDKPDSNTNTSKPSGSQSGSDDSDKEEVKEKSLSSIISAVYEGVEDLPRLGNTTLNSDNFASFAFIKKIDGMKGLASEAMIGSIAHSVVAIRVPEGESAKDVASQVKANANPRKWICVEAEKVIVKRHKQTVLLIMTTADAADKIAANFDALY